MPYVAHTSLEPRFCPRFACEPHAPKVDFVRPNGAMLDPAELPSLARQVSPHKTIPDFINMMGCWCVSEPFQALVEAREPGVHAFYRLPLYRRDGSAIERSYYLFDVRQQIDAIDVEHSEVTWSEAAPGLRVLHVGSFEKLAVDPVKVADRHVWRGKTQLSGTVFLSDDLANAVVEAKLMKLRLQCVRDGPSMHRSQT